MRPLLLYICAFFADALLRRALTYAVVLYGAEVLGSGRWAGALYLGVTLPYLVSWYAGVVIDNGARRGTLRAATAAIAVLGVVLPAATASTVATGPAVAAILLSYGTASAFAYPAFLAGVTHVAGQSSVVTATVVMNALSLASYVTAPVAVGALRAVLHWPAVFLSLGTLALISVFLAWLSSGSIAPPVTSPRGFSHTFPSPASALGATWRFARHDQALRPLFVVVALFSAMVVGPIEVFMPLFSTQTLGLSPLVSGAFLATGGVGAVIGAIAAIRVLRAHHVWRPLCTATIAGSLVIVVMSASPASVAFPLYFIAGMFAGLFSSLSLAAVQSLVSDTDRGRAMGLYTLALGAPPALGGAIAGSMVDAVTAPLAMRFAFSSVATVFALLLFSTSGQRPPLQAPTLWATNGPGR